MKTNGTNKALTFGDFVTAAYRACAAQRAKGLVLLAVNAHLVVFQGQQRFVIPEEQDETQSFTSSAG